MLLVRKIWTKFQQGAADNWQAILVLFVLNFFPIAWWNIYTYKTGQLAVLGLDALFVLAGTIMLTGIFMAVVPAKAACFLGRMVLIFSALLGAVEVFSIYSYQTLLGAGIITAILQTNPAEAAEFWQMYIGWRGSAGLLVILLAAVFFKKKGHILAKHCQFNIAIAYKGRILSGILLAGIISGGMLWQNYCSFIFNDSLDIPIVRLTRVVTISIKNITAFKELEAKSVNSVEITENDSDVPYVVFILGESTNRDRMHLYGYPLENTPKLDELAKAGDIAVFKDTISPQGATVAVLRELFTFCDAESAKEWYEYNSLIDVMKAAGYKTYWLSNQESSGIWGNAAQLFAERSDKAAFTQLRESHEDSGKLDEALFPLIDDALKNPAAKNFYVVHLMGGHGLYYMRFPYMFTKFTKDDIPAPQNKLDDNKRTEIAQYENALFYNDFIVSSIIGKFQDKEAIVIYLPDHGETIYDDGGSLAGHVEENPNHQQLEVPLIFWASPAYKAKHQAKWQAICAAVNRPYMTDDMIHTIMDLLGIKTAEFNPAKSVINTHFDAGRQRLVRGKDYDTQMKVR